MDTENTLGVALLDIRTGFTLVTQSIEKDIPYGVFALTLINMNYERVRECIGNMVCRHFKKGLNPDNIEKFAEYLYKTLEFHIVYASEGYLGLEQAHMVIGLFVREMLIRIKERHFEISDIEKCMPAIITNPKIHTYVKEILKRNSDDLTPVMNETGESGLMDSQLFNMDLTVYYLNSISDYILLDLKMYLERSGKTVKECECCSRMFLPTRNSDKYCRLPTLERKGKCSEIMHASPTDEFVRARNKARDKQHKQVRYYESKGTYEHNFLYGLYDKWSDECKQKFKEFKAKEDIGGFLEWIKETRFSGQTLQEKWEQSKGDGEHITPK